MEKVYAIAKVVMPIFTAVFFGILARRKGLLTASQNKGLQQYVMKFGLPCVLFNSCLSAELGAEAISSFLLVMPLMIASVLAAFRLRKTRFPYHNFPMLFAAQESGMLGIPLYMTLFGAGEAFRMGVLDLAQTPSAVPTIAILGSDAGQNPSAGHIVKKVFTSPFLLMSLLGLALNLSGIADWLNAVGIGPVITETTGFIAQPVSAVMLFSVGYNFSLDKEKRGKIFRIAALHLAVQLVFCLIVQAALFLIPGVESQTRWAILLFFSLPASYIAPTLARTDEEAGIASGVCSILTVVCLAVFCVIAAAVA